MKVTTTLDGVEVIYFDNNFSPKDDEIHQYVKRGIEKYGASLKRITLTGDSDPDFVGVDYELEGRRFQRLRRITGYLVGTLDRFNDGKKAEEHDRVKHDTNTGG